MPSGTCYPIDDPNTLWLYCPSFGPAILFCLLFGITSVAHVVQGVVHRKPFTAVLAMAAIWETAGYICRILSIESQLNAGVFTAQQMLILLAPLLINAFVYMVLGRAVHFFHQKKDTDKVFGIKARYLTLIFVLCDVSAFIVQAAGGLMTTSSNPPEVQKQGLHVYTGGVGIQIFFICIFIALAARFHQTVLRFQSFSGVENSSGNGSEYSLSSKSFQLPRISSPSTATPASPRDIIRLLYTLYAVLLLIVIRNIYRLAEFGSGVESSITTHEWYGYVFDALPMFACLVIFNVFHPGQILRGPRSDFSEENRERKEAKKAKRAEKKNVKMAEKVEKEKKKQEKVEGILEV